MYVHWQNSPEFGGTIYVGSVCCKRSNLLYVSFYLRNEQHFLWQTVLCTFHQSMLPWNLHIMYLLCKNILFHFKWFALSVCLFSHFIQCSTLQRVIKSHDRQSCSSYTEIKYNGCHKINLAQSNYHRVSTKRKHCTVFALLFVQGLVILYQQATHSHIINF